MKKVLLGIFLLLGSLEVSAGSWSEWAIPERIDVERGNGIMVWGEFGNSEGCASSNRVFIPERHPQYDKTYALVLAAFSANKEVQVYVTGCQKVGWYTSTEDAFNYTIHTVHIRQPQ